MRSHVYRICEAQTWAQTQLDGQLPLSELDARDGFVHLSTAAQVAGTLRRFFAGREDLVVLTVAVDQLLLGGSLTFEPSGHAEPESERERELFPHFYGQVARAAIVSADILELDDHGDHRLPAALHQAIVDER